MSKTSEKPHLQLKFIEKIKNLCVDNILLEISNIHIRFENSKDVSFTTGLIIKEIIMETVSGDWKTPIFVDRYNEST